MTEGTTRSDRACRSVTIHGIRNCDTMKKARGWLDEAGIAYRFHDYKVDGIKASMIERWCTRVGWERLLNRSGTTFRKVVPESERSTVDATRARALMLAYPSMIRRPVLEMEMEMEMEMDDSLTVGFDPKAYERAFAAAG